MADSNNKTSLLVNDQLPAFVLEEHDTFVKFLEYYYKSLEEDGQTLYVAKNFMNYLDIDQINQHIIDEHNPGGNREYYDYHAFLQKMYDTFIKYVPDSVLADRVNLVKHAKEFYRSTGSEKSVRFLIQALFNKEASFYYPKTDILRASDGKWFIEKSLKVTDVKVNNVANGIAVTNFANTTIKGVTSNATAIVERVDSYFDKGQLVYELKLSNIYKEFENSEGIYTYYTEEGIDNYLTANLFGSGVITYVQLITGGSGYTEGTSVPIVSSYGSGAEIVISKVSKGSIQAVGVVAGGAGFKVNDSLVIAGPGSGAAGIVSDVDDTSLYHPNSYNVVWTTISLVANNILGNVNNNVYETWAYSNLAAVYTLASNLTVNTGTTTATSINLSEWMSNSNVYFETADSINVANIIVTVTSTNLISNVITVSPGLPGNLVSSTIRVIKKANVNTTIANAVSYFVYSNCGPAFSCDITNGGNNYFPPISITISANSIISKLGIIGRMQIINGGSGYAIGDWINFENSFGSAGAGAIANVTNVAANGMITQVKFQQMPGHPIGGSGYDWFNLPAAKVISGTGTGANIAVTAIIGHNERLIQSVSNVGTIQTLTIISGGSGYTDNPYLALETLGDGTANASLTTITGVFSYPGRYISDDGHISSYNFLENRDYYQEFSYVVKVDETINKYRAAVSDLVHPAGTKLFGEYTLLFDNGTTTNTNVTVEYANTELIQKPLDTYYQVQGYTSGVFAPNTIIGQANAEFIAGTYSMNTVGHLTTYAAQNNNIVIYYPSHSYLANSRVYLLFDGPGTWANLANINYTVTSSNVDYLIAYNPLLVSNVGGTLGNVTVYNPDVMIAVPYGRPAKGANVYIQFQTVDPSLANGFYYVTNRMGSNTFNVLHPDMITANTVNGVANLITSKIVVGAYEHEFNLNNQVYIEFLDGDSANTVNGYYTITEEPGYSTFNIAGENIIFSNSTVRIFQRRSQLVINNHPYDNTGYVYITHTSGDQANVANGIQSPVKTGPNTMRVFVNPPATGNSDVRVWYQTNNYSNIMFTTHRSTNGLQTNDNVEIEFFTSARDIANGIYMVKDVYSSNTYNIYYNANDSIVNSTVTYGSQVFIPDTTNTTTNIAISHTNTINSVSHSGIGIVPYGPGDPDLFGTKMEGECVVSLYK